MMLAEADKMKCSWSRVQSCLLYYTSLEEEVGVTRNAILELGHRLGMYCWPPIDWQTWRASGDGDSISKYTFRISEGTAKWFSKASVFFFPLSQEHPTKFHINLLLVLTVFSNPIPLLLFSSLSFALPPLPPPLASLVIPSDCSLPCTHS